MLLNFVLYLIIGKIFIWAIPKSPLNYFEKYKLVRELLACQFCLGFWVYFFLALVMLPFLEGVPDIIILNQIIIAIVSSFLVYVFSAGWDALFRDLLVEME